MTFEELKEDFAQQLNGKLDKYDLKYLLYIADKNQRSIENAIKYYPPLHEEWLTFAKEIRNEMIDEWECAARDNRLFSMIEIVGHYIWKRYYAEFL